MRLKLCVLILVVAAIATLPVQAQDEAKIQKLFQDAIMAMGGGAFLNVTDMITEGNYFQFDRDGNSSGLIKFYDWTKLPDKSRNEIGNNKKARDVYVFNLEKKQGWILEGQKDTREATPEEMKEFQNDVNHSIDTIFRFRYKDSANKLFYMGLGDGRDVQLECVQLLNPDNDEVNIYFDRMTKLPAKIQFASVDKNGLHIRHSDEFSQWHVIQGVNTPLRVDSYRNGKVFSQAFITKITYNNNLTDSFFSKPEPPK